MATTYNPEANDQIRKLNTDELAAVSGGSGGNQEIVCEVKQRPTLTDDWKGFVSAAGGPNPAFMY